MTVNNQCNHVACNQMVQTKMFVNLICQKTQQKLTNDIMPIEAT